jgi:hypothetical protein
MLSAKAGELRTRTQTLRITAIHSRQLRQGRTLATTRCNAELTRDLVTGAEPITLDQPRVYIGVALGREITRGTAAHEGGTTPEDLENS